ncbi:MAG: site-specific integrase, partial [Humidesulfovibrio sp.]|nr:site-specific integrase [Humidesulfovibrio sp.]
MKHNTKYPGVRYREHSTRRKGGKLDRYFFIRYYDSQGKRHEEGLGWSSEGWTAEQASKVLGDIRTNIRLGSGPASLADKRKLKEQAQREQAARETLDRIADISVAETAARFLSWARVNKRSWKTDESR